MQQEIQPGCLYMGKKKENQLCQTDFELLPDKIYGFG